MIVMVTNTIVPYCFDIVHIIGLPHNFSHRFRYRERWIKLPYETKKIKEQEGIIVLRNFETGDFIPTRYIRIENVLSVGDINYIEFRVGEYFPVRWRKIVSDRIKQTLKEGDYANEGGKPLECLLFETDADFIAEAMKKTAGDEQQKWGEILTEIGGLHCYKDFSFLKILHIRDSKERTAIAEEDETGKYSYALDPANLYFLDVIQHIPWGIDSSESIEAPYDVELKTETDEVVVLRKIQRVVGKYDLLRFIFKTTAGYSEKSTFLEVDNKQGGELAQYGLPALFLPVRIKPPGWMKAIFWGKIGLGALAVVTVIASAPLARMLSIGADWIRTIALLFLVFVSGKWEDLFVAFVKETKAERLN
jgi:hypothetical protein